MVGQRKSMEMKCTVEVTFKCLDLHFVQQKIFIEFISL